MEIALRTGDWIGQLALPRLAPLLMATTALLGVALLLDGLLARRVRASLRLFLYLAVLLRALIPLEWGSPLALFGGDHLVQVISGGASIAVTAGQPMVTSARTTAWVGLGHLAGVVVLLGWWAWVRVALARSLRAARLLGPAGARRPLWVHPHLGPLAAGVWRPRIVVPAALVAPRHALALALVLRHEGAHLARRDPLLEAVVQLICIAAWPLLPLWIAAHRVRVLVELATDERALAAADGPERRRYGELLLALASAGPLPGMAGGLAFGSVLTARIRALQIRRHWPALAQVPLVATLVGLALACSATPALDGEDPADGKAVERPATAQPSGGVSPVIIERIVRLHTAAARQCYQNARARLPGGPVRVGLAFTIGARGLVEGADVEGAGSGDGAMDRCLVDVIRSLQFPHPPGRGSAPARYTFAFQAPPEAPAPAAAGAPAEKAIQPVVARHNHH
jgi:TonB family protein